MKISIRCCKRVWMATHWGNHQSWSILSGWIACCYILSFCSPCWREGMVFIVPLEFLFFYFCTKKGKKIKINCFMKNGDQGLWLGTMVALFVQAILLAIVTWRTNWEKEVKHISLIFILYFISSSKTFRQPQLNWSDNWFGNH